MSNSRIIVALDHGNEPDALALCQRLDPSRCRVKIANTLFVHGGPRLVGRIVDLGFDVFLDLKFHDIPAQCAGACRSAADLGVWMLNVHAAGGPEMLSSAAEAVRATSGARRRPHIVAVTVLTSLSDDDLDCIGLRGPPLGAVERLAHLTAQSGLDGIVCSPQELVALREKFPPPFLMVTPGIRPAGVAGAIGDDDQKRVTTPLEAISGGADFLVVGRPVTAAADPLAALDRISVEISQD